MHITVIRLLKPQNCNQITDHREQLAGRRLQIQTLRGVIHDPRAGQKDRPLLAEDGDIVEFRRRVAVDAVRCL